MVIGVDEMRRMFCFNILMMVIFDVDNDSDLNEYDDFVDGDDHYFMMVIMLMMNLMLVIMLILQKVQGPLPIGHL